MHDIIFIASGIVMLTISPFMFTTLSYVLYKANGGKLSIISYTKLWLKNK